MRWWVLLIIVLVIGYNSFTRTFAYIGVPPARVFLGEIVLAAFFATSFKAIDWFFLKAPRSRFLEFLRLGMITFGLYGLVCAAHGWIVGHDRLTMLQNLAFNYYPLYLIVGLYFAVRSPEPFLPTLFRIMGWVHGIYGIMYVLFLNRMQESFMVPGAPVSFFSQPNGSAVCVLGLLAFEKRWSRSLVPILLNLFVMFGVQIRSEWLGFFAAFAVWSVLSRRLGQFFGFVGALTLLATIGILFDVRIPGLAGRGGEVSVAGVVGRAIATVDPHLAGWFVDDAESLKGTTEWRRQWWDNIWHEIHDGTNEKFFLGLGYGYELRQLGENVEEGVRTPHNVFFLALGYGGWLGVIALAMFQLPLAWGMWRVYKRTRDPFGIAFYIVGITMALFGNQLENPFGAIPFYLVCGACLAPLFLGATRFPFPFPPLPVPPVPARAPSHFQAYPTGRPPVQLPPGAMRPDHPASRN